MASPEEIARRDAVRAQVAALEQERKAYEQAAVARQGAWEANLDARARARLAPELRAALDDRAARRSEPQKIALRTAFLAQDPGHQQRSETIKSLRDREPKFPKTHVAHELAVRAGRPTCSGGESSPSR